MNENEINPPAELLNVHEVLAEATAETERQEGPMVSHTFRLPLKLKSQTEQICRSNGTTASEFYRKCSETLVRDYLP